MNGTTKESTVRKFELTPSQYELFRFTVERPSTLRIRMIATAPVSLVLLDSEDRVEYEASWGRKSDLDETVSVAPGTWYLAVEGSTEPSSGRIEVFK